MNKRLMLILIALLLSMLVIACASKVEQKLQEGGKFLDQQQWQEAITAYSEAIELDPDNVDAYLNRCWAYRRTGQFDNALEDANRAIELEPTNAMAYQNRGYTHKFLHQYELALADASNAIELDPELASAYDCRASIYSTQGQYELALSDASKAIELDPNLCEAYESRANAYFALGQYDKAKVDASSAIQLDPNYTLAYVVRAAANQYLGEMELALSDYTKAIEVALTASIQATAYEARADFCAGQMDMDKAIADYTKAIELDPILETYMKRGICYLERGQFNLAVIDFNEAIELEPNMPWAYFYMSWINCEIGQFDLAIADSTKAIELDPSMADAYVNRSWAYGGTGQLELAIADASKAIELDPKAVGAYRNRCTAYLETGQFELAIADANKVIELFPDMAWAYANRSIAYTSLGMDDLAKSDVEKAVSLGFERTILEQRIEEMNANKSPEYKLVFEDDFSSSQSGWIEQVHPEFECRYKDGKYHISVMRTQRARWLWNSRAGRLSDFILEIDAQLVSGPKDTYFGIIFRTVTDREFYYLLISGDKHYSVGIHNMRGWTPLKRRTFEYRVKEGYTTNHLRVVCQGNQLDIYINGSYIAKLNDDSFDSGYVGLIVESADKSEPDCQVAFDNLRIYKIE